MYIEIDDKSGFCFGVVTAITKAEKSMEGGRRLYSLGDIVHNSLEVRRLESMGMKTVYHEDLPSLSGQTLLIRAHGEPPTTYRQAEELGVEIIDATCPVVARLQKLVIEAYEQMKPIGGQVVIFGKRGHAEVIGLAGQIEEKAIVVEKEEDLDAVDFSRPVYLISQTTQSVDIFNRIGEIIIERAADPNKVVIRDTICRQVANREGHLREFAGRFDVIVFVCGAKSSNGKVLYEVCREANQRSYKIEAADELKSEWFKDCESVGICGATSTPKWLMREMADRIASLG
ncbi:MAG: 4-hydroxy-3-methylbut-2-enyl diphosphate reductase [Tidjanibacter sp.]|nr:4-hydroxy-3-methylbut-2-enyl diphosphate reductase [Tidjanibacter sp.]